AGGAKTGLWFRETRYLRTLRWVVNGAAPHLCSLGVAGTACVEAFYIHPELREFGGGGSGQSTSDETFGPDGVRHRAVDLRVRHEVDPGGLETRAIVANRSRSLVRLRVELELDADFADLTD